MSRPPPFIKNIKIKEKEHISLYIDIETIITLSKAIGAIGAIGALVFGAYRWYLKQERLGGEIESLKTKHNEDIKKIEEEACLHTYGILACLKGLQEQGCNGPVTEAIGKFEKYINKKAHDQEE